MTQRISTRATQLTAQRVPFVHAVVVRAQVPTSAKAGDDAIVLGDGSIEGFVGGQCAETSVRTAALKVLSSGESVLLRVLPEGEDGFPDSPGAQVVVNPCLCAATPIQAIDPVCGLTLTVMRDTPHLRVDGVDHCFCMPGCRDEHSRDGRSGPMSTAATAR